MQELNNYSREIKVKDPLGWACLDAANGKMNRELEVWINGIPDTSLPPALFLRSFQSMKRYEKLALSLCKGKILDAGAGGGAHSLVLQRRGFSVTAVELSPGACLAMRQRGIHDVRCSDISKIKAEKFDTILLLMNGIGIGGSRKGALRLLIHLKGLLNAGGQILTDSTDIAYFFHREMNPEKKCIYEVQYTVKYGATSQSDFPWVYFNKKALSALAERAGLSLSTIYTSDDAHFLAALRPNNL